MFLIFRVQFYRFRALALRASAGACLLAGLASAQTPAGLGPAAGEEQDWNVHAQSTFVDEWHYAFPSPYEGPDSFTSAAESKYTLSFSLYLGLRAWKGAEIYFDPEVFQGYGLSNTLGIAGFPNGEAIKAGFPHLHYNTSRLFIRQTFGFGGGKEKVDDDADQLAGTVDVNRLTFTVGKFAANDYFDDNSYSHDARTQFLNWALLESGAWDIPSEVLGFTVGGVAEWHSRTGSLRYGIMMEPTGVNSPSLDPHILKAYGQILEYAFNYSAGQDQSGVIRPFAFWNRAFMGLFPVAAAQEGPQPPNVNTTAAYRSKEGAGVSWDQALTTDVGAFVRLSWNDGRSEDIAYTEIDRSIAAGLSVKGTILGRVNDTFGLAAAVNGLASAHRLYLEEGGVGFLLGDGGLQYKPEEDLECYYSFQAFRWLWISPDYQYIEHPGYNSDRGGLAVYSIRVHISI